MEKLTIIIPLGGRGERFRQAGYKLPKPLIKVFGKPLICWLLDCLDLTRVSRVLIPYNKELRKYNFELFLQGLYPRVAFLFHCLEAETAGAVDSISRVLKAHERGLEEKEAIMCIDGDNFYTCDVIQTYLKCPGRNAIFYAINRSPTPIYSYLTINSQGLVGDILEKVKISDEACTGIYCFDSLLTLQRGLTQTLEFPTASEYYMSQLVWRLLTDLPFYPLEVDPSTHVCLGTPLQLRAFCNNVPVHQARPSMLIPVSKMRVCFDLDETLVSAPTVVGDYSSVKPLIGMIAYLRYLKRLGVTIIIQTARRMRTHRGNEGRVLADIGKLTFETLERFDIPYDEIYFGKPHADFYIDDKAVNCFDDYEKEMGFYKTQVDPRAFNVLETGIDTVKKRAKDLSGEINFYLQIPEPVKDMFPLMTKFDPENTWFELEKIQGLTLSELYVSGELTSTTLNCVLGSLKRLHESGSPSGELNIYANYVPKLQQRYQEYAYGDFPEAEAIYGLLLAGLEDYTKQSRGIRGVIHGDAVFTNILINQYGKIKFIDMRGKLGSLCTVFGDRNYDYAKLYQSLLGYDEILHDKHLEASYKYNLLGFFDGYILDNLGAQTLADIKLIAKSLLFTLLPLHANAKCKDYYKLIYAIN